MSVERLKGVWHGIEGRAVSRDSFAVTAVREGSPAASSGVQPGDVIRSVETTAVHRQLDLECALLEAETGKPVAVTVERNKQPLELKLALAAIPSREPDPVDRYWRSLGLKLEPVSETELQGLGTRLQGRPARGGGADRRPRGRTGYPLGRCAGWHAQVGNPLAGKRQLYPQPS